jgi:hypothetical protein
MNVHYLQIYTVIGSLLMLVNVCLKFKKSLIRFVATNMRELENYHHIDDEIKQLEVQIEAANKSLILMDNNISEISLLLKKLTRTYQGKENELQNNFLKIKNESQVQIVEKYQKQLLIEIVESAGAQIMNNKEMQKKFIESLSES